MEACYGNISSRQVQLFFLLTGLEILMIRVRVAFGSSLANCQSQEWFQHEAESTDGTVATPSTDGFGSATAQTRAASPRPQAVGLEPKGRIRDLEKRALHALLPGQCIRWMKAHLQQTDVDSGRVTADDCHGNGQADVLANQGTAQHGLLDPDVTWHHWADFVNKVHHFWRLVGPQLRERPDDEPRTRLPAEPAVEAPAVSGTEQDLSEAPFQVGTHPRVVRHEAFFLTMPGLQQTNRQRESSYWSCQLERRIPYWRSRRASLSFVLPGATGNSSAVAPVEPAPQERLLRAEPE
eukprot:874893-Amphidinium_carterae.3